MDQSIKQRILDQFPLLKDDLSFDVTSPATPNYNCISWAMKYSDRWTQYNSDSKMHDGIVYWWPDGVPQEPTIEAYKMAFQKIGYEGCGSPCHEDGFIKIALYENKGICSHASRELRNGLWTSKLGQNHDIQHSSPFTIEGQAYGRAVVFMKKKFE